MTTGNERFGPKPVPLVGTGGSKPDQMLARSIAVTSEKGGIHEPVGRGEPN
jgi:hypothetical protein